MLIDSSILLCLGISLYTHIALIPAQAHEGKSPCQSPQNTPFLMFLALFATRSHYPPTSLPLSPVLCLTPDTTAPFLRPVAHLRHNSTLPRRKPIFIAPRRATDEKNPFHKKVLSRVFFLPSTTFHRRKPETIFEALVQNLRTLPRTPRRGTSVNPYATTG